MRDPVSSNSLLATWTDTSVASAFTSATAIEASATVSSVGLSRAISTARPARSSMAFAAFNRITRSPAAATTSGSSAPCSYLVSNHSRACCLVNARVAGVVIRRHQLDALQLVVATILVGEMLDDDRGFAPVVEPERERVREDPAIQRERLPAAGLRDDRAILSRLVQQRHVKGARIRIEKRRRCAVVAVLQPLVALDAALDRVRGLAFARVELHAVDAP
jgi:hypothetical protein